MSPGKEPEAGASRISLWTAIAIVVANMVGVGVFTSLGFQVAAIPSGFAIMVLWVVGGLIAFAGACSYGEIAGMMPRSGGEYHYLSETYHPLAGFLTGWISITVGFAAPIAVAGLAFGEYFAAATKWGNAVVWALLVVVVVTAVHLSGIRVAARFQIAFTTIKILAILILILCAMGMGEPRGLELAPAAGDGSWILSAPFAISLFFVMYAYSGWNAAAYVAGEVENPSRNVPLALLLGTGVVTALYVLLNAAFLRVTPVEAMRGEPEVGYVAATYLFGERGGQIMGLVIAVGLISTVSSMVWAGPRVGQVMGEDYRLFGWLERRSADGTPRVAILVQGIVVVALLLLVPFERIIYYIQAILTVSSMLVVAGVYYLRWKDPGRSRPYRTWGYPVTPALFLLASAYMLVRFVQDKPVETAGGLLTLVAGGAAYVAAKRMERGVRAST